MSSVLQLPDIKMTIKSRTLISSAKNDRHMESFFQVVATLWTLVLSDT